MRTRIYAKIAVLLALVGIAKAQTSGQYGMLRKNSGAGFATTWHTVGNDQLFATNGSGVLTPIAKSTYEPALTIGTGITRSGATISVNMAALTPPWSGITSKPTTLSGYGITDPIVLTSGSYGNPGWITSLAWAKLTGTPTTRSGYGITDAIGTGGEAGTVASIGNLTGVVTSTNRATAIADAALSIAKTSGLQTALDARQPLDSDLTSIAALTTTSFGRSVLTQANAAALRATLGLGSLATASGVTSAQVSDATDAATPSTVVKRDSQGSANFAATDGVAMTLTASGIGDGLSATAANGGIGVFGGSNTGTGVYASSQSGTAMTLYSGGGDLIRASNAATADVFVVDSSGSIVTGTIPSSGIQDATDVADPDTVVKRSGAGEAAFATVTGVALGAYSSGVGSGIVGYSEDGIGLTAQSTTGTAIVGFSGSGLQVRLQNGGGDVFVVTNNGTLTAGTIPAARISGAVASATTVVKTTTPASATATGTQGQVAWDATYLYICTATNTWRRVVISSW